MLCGEMKTGCPKAVHNHREPVTCRAAMNPLDWLFLFTPTIALALGMAQQGRERRTNARAFRRHLVASIQAQPGI